jgi:hypothetical protein
VGLGVGAWGERWGVSVFLMFCACLAFGCVCVVAVLCVCGAVTLALIAPKRCATLGALCFRVWGYGFRVEG